MSEIDKKWYVVRAVSGQEKRVQETVETEIAAAGLQDYVGQVLIPMEKVFTIRNGKKVSKERNLFPGYVYIEASLVGEVPHIIRNVTNVIGFLGAEKRGEPFRCVKARSTASWVWSTTWRTPMRKSTFHTWSENS